MTTLNLDDLRTRWQGATRHLPATTELRDEIFAELIAAYTAPDRHYHDLLHIAECLKEFEGVRHLAHDPAALQIAIWFHDVVYDGRRSDNEARSADAAAAALARLGATAAFVEDVRRLIRFTCHDAGPATADGKLIADIDLASLAAAPEVFGENTRRIRREYPHVPDDAFRRGRAEILARFLQRPRIYYTDVFFDRYERRARENLEREVGTTGEHG